MNFFANFFIATLIFSTFLAFSQTKAVTEDGKKVLLFNDKTWKYESNESINIAKPIPTSEKKYIKAAYATTEVKSKKTPFSVFINPNKWEYGKSKNNKDAEFEFQLKNKTLFAIMINEKVETSLEALKEIAISNAKNAATNVNVVNEEYRLVNGVKLLHPQITGEIQNFNFKYYSHYMTTSKSCVQLITYTYTSSFAEYNADAEELLNGLVIRE